MKIQSLSSLKVAQLLLLLQSKVLATPTAGFPFSQQLPDVARVGELYSFTINKETYESSSDEGSVTYSADNLPSWLSFDSSSLTFTGTPSTDDASNSLEFNLIGTDSIDSGVLNNTVSIVVSNDPGPTLISTNSIITQLETYGSTNGYNGLIIEPNHDFSIKFDSNTFEMISGSTNNIVSYYGKSLNRTSLPPWCSFDSDTLTFSGTAPTINSEIAPSQDFGFIFIATDYEGYTGAYGSFYLLVGAHELTTNLTDPVVVNSTAGDSFQVDIPLDSVLLDGAVISTGNISSVELYEAPSWVSIDGAGSLLVGNIPSDLDENLLLNVTVSDIYGNSVYLNFELDLLLSVFTVDSLPDVNATRGQYFTYTLNNDDFSDLNGTTIKASFDNADWLTYYYTNYTFVGTTPNNLDSVNVTVEGTMNSLSDSRSFKINGVGFIVSSSSIYSSMSRTLSSTSMVRTSSSMSATSSSSITSSAIPSSSAYSSYVPSPNKKSNNSKTLAIALGVAIPLVIIIAAALIFFCCWKRRKSDKKDDEEDKKGMYINPQGTSDTLNNEEDQFNDKSGYDADAKRLSALNVLKLNEAALAGVHNGDDSSSLTNVGSNDSFDADGAGAGGKITKSWRNNNNLKDQNDGWKPRDSLSSLATVATTDLLTVRVTDDPNKVRKSQSNFFGVNNGSNLSNSTSGANYEVADNGAMGGSTSTNSGLKPTTITGTITRDYSASSKETSTTSLDPKNRGSGFTDATSSNSKRMKLVDFTGRVQQQQNHNRSSDELESFEGVIENNSSSSFLI